MLDKCANPGCSAVLHRLRDGRLFAFDARAQQPAPGTHSRTRSQGQHYHWLCNECSKTLTLIFDADSLVSVVRKEPLPLPSLRLPNATAELAREVQLILRNRG